MGVFRDTLLKKFFPGRNFRTVFLFARTARFEVVVGLIFLFLTELPIFLIPNFFSRPILQTLGLSYLVTGIFYPWLFPLDSRREGGLCIFQFLLVKNRGLGAFGWMKLGLRKVEKQLMALGISVPLGVLSLGASYAILNGMDLEAELRTLGDWLRDQDGKQPWTSVDTIMFQAKQAERNGGKPV